MSALQRLQAASTLNDLAALLQFKPPALAYVLFRLPAARKYNTFDIPKRRGGTRTIRAPIDALKLLQKKLSTLLQDCLDEINAAKRRKDRVAHGFKRKRSILTNAKEHRNRRYVFNLDLEDFFPSINFGRVRGYFMADRNFALKEPVATLIAQIACHENALPQGSPCSPVISNLIAHILDMHLVGLAAKTGCTYSRYADDLSFSTNEQTFPAQVAEPSDHNSWIAGRELHRLITLSGFRINARKVSMQCRMSRQEVTGLVVNRRINVRHEYRHNVRAMVHQLLTTGSFDTYVTIRDTGVPRLEPRPGTSRQLHGMLGFIDTVDVKHAETLPPAARLRGLSSRELLYRRFLLFTNFFSAETPVILCEGETDNVYLTHAIRRLAMEYPKLARVDDRGKIQILVRLYKYRKSSTARILGLREGGTGPLANFIATYKKETTKFQGPGLTHPVIILYDNDSGAKAIRNAVKEVCGSSPAPTAPFVKVFKNLYVVTTPLINGARESTIEDFFDGPIKATVLNHKTFSNEDNYDTSLHYGKKIFANSVIRPHASTINFDGFRPLLDNLVAAIEAYEAALGAAATTNSTTN